MKGRYLFIVLVFAGLTTEEGWWPPPAIWAQGRQAAWLPPAVGGAWEGSPYPLEVDLPLQEKPFHAALLPTGKVLLWRNGQDRSYPGYPSSQVREFDSKQASLMVVPSATDNIGCSGHSFLSDGRLLVTGGPVSCNPAPCRGANWAWIYDPTAQQWTKIADMPGAGNSPDGGRWYPTNTTLQDGRVLVASGRNGNGEVNQSLVMYDPRDSQEPWSVVHPNAPPLQLYPHMYLVNGGNVLFVNPAPGVPTFSLDPLNPSSFQLFGSLQEPLRGGGASALMPNGTKGSSHVWVMGGGMGHMPTNLVEKLELPASRKKRRKNSVSTTWEGNPAWNNIYARHHPTSVTLPDGKILLVGGVTHLTGDDIPVHDPELFDPARPDEGWSVMNPPPSQIARGYHAVSLLLPDARVMVVGGDGVGGQATENPNGKKIDIYRPPYLFKRDPLQRPAFVSWPPVVSYGKTYSVDVSTPSHKTITQITFIRPAAVTHSVNMSERYVSVKFKGNKRNKTISMTIPENPSLLPPGHYMMFLIDADGVPSEARFTRVE